MKRLFLLAAVCSLASVLSLPMAAAQDAQTPDEICAANLPATTPETLQFDQPEQVLEAGVNYQAIFCTEVGAVYVDLFEGETPITVNNFVFLAQNGYYNNSVFHRVIENFMAQAGDPVGNPAGTGGPGYQFQDEPVGFLTFDSPGWLAMANAGPSTNGSQFFITTAVTDWLNYQHTIFGRVLEGQSVVDSLPDNQTTPDLLSRLDTVVIITDPASVNTSFEIPALATREEVTALIDGLPAQFPTVLETLQASELASTLTVDEASVQDIAEYIAAASESADPAALEAFYGSNPAEYHGDFTIANSACDLTSFPVGLIGYQLDAYPDSAAAQTALADPQFVALQSAFGFEPYESEVGLTVYKSEATICDQPMMVVRAVDQHGRFVTMVDVAFQEGVIAPAEQTVQVSDVVLTQIAPLFAEAPLAEIFRAELLQ